MNAQRGWTAWKEKAQATRQSRPRGILRQAVLLLFMSQASKSTEPKEFGPATKVVCNVRVNAWMCPCCARGAGRRGRADD